MGANDVNLTIRGQLVVDTNNAEQSIGNVVKRTEQYIDTINGKIKKTNLTVVKKEFDEQTGAVKQTTQQLVQYTNQMGRVTTKTGDFFRNEKGQYKKVADDTYQLVKSEEKLVKSTTEVSNTSKEASGSINQMSESEQRAVSHSNNLDLSFRSLGETLVKVAKFKIVTELLMAFINAGEKAVEIVRNFDDALVEFKKVSDLSGEALDEYTKKLGELGEATFKSRTEMLESATIFRKSGFTDEQSAQLAQVATMFQNVADSELSAGDSASYVISQMKAFGYTTTEEAQSIIDITNEV